MKTSDTTHYFQYPSRQVELRPPQQARFSEPEQRPATVSETVSETFSSPETDWCSLQVRHEEKRAGARRRHVRFQELKDMYAKFERWSAQEPSTHGRHEVRQTRSLNTAARRPKTIVFRGHAEFDSLSLRTCEVNNDLIMASLEEPGIPSKHLSETFDQVRDSLKVMLEEEEIRVTALFWALAAKGHITINQAHTSIQAVKNTCKSFVDGDGAEDHDEEVARGARIMELFMSAEDIPIYGEDPIKDREIRLLLDEAIASRDGNIEGTSAKPIHRLTKYTQETQSGSLSTTAGAEMDNSDHDRMLVNQKQVINQSKQKGLASPIHLKSAIKGQKSTSKVMLPQLPPLTEKASARYDSRRYVTDDDAQKSIVPTSIVQSPLKKYTGGPMRRVLTTDEILPDETPINPYFDEDGQIYDDHDVSFESASWTADDEYKTSSMIRDNVEAIHVAVEASLETYIKQRQSQLIESNIEYCSSNCVSPPPSYEDWLRQYGRRGSEILADVKKHNEHYGLQEASDAGEHDFGCCHKYDDFSENDNEKPPKQSPNKGRRDTFIMRNSLFEPRSPSRQNANISDPPEIPGTDIFVNHGIPCWTSDEDIGKHFGDAYQTVFNRISIPDDIEAWVMDGEIVNSIVRPSLSSESAASGNLTSLHDQPAFGEVERTVSVTSSDCQARKQSKESSVDDHSKRVSTWIPRLSLRHKRMTRSASKQADFRLTNHATNPRQIKGHEGLLNDMMKDSLKSTASRENYKISNSHILPLPRTAYVPTKSKAADLSKPVVSKEDRRSRSIKQAYGHDTSNLCPQILAPRLPARSLQVNSPTSSRNEIKPDIISDAEPFDMSLPSWLPRPVDIRDLTPPVTPIRAGNFSQETGTTQPSFRKEPKSREADMKSLSLEPPKQSPTPMQATSTSPSQLPETPSWKMRYISLYPYTPARRSQLADYSTDMLNSPKTSPQPINRHLQISETSFGMAPSASYVASTVTSAIGGYPPRGIHTRPANSPARTKQYPPTLKEAAILRNLHSSTERMLAHIAAQEAHIQSLETRLDEQTCMFALYQAAQADLRLSILRKEWSRVTHASIPKKSCTDINAVLGKWIATLAKIEECVDVVQSIAANARANNERIEVCAKLAQYYYALLEAFDGRFEFAKLRFGMMEHMQLDEDLVEVIQAKKILDMGAREYINARNLDWGWLDG